MNAIKIYFLPLVFLVIFNLQGFSQNDFYNEKKEVVLTSENDSIVRNEYFTEKDYNEIHRIKKHKRSKDSNFYYENEITQKEESSKREKNGFFVEVAAEVVVEVMINTIFILATFW